MFYGGSITMQSYKKTRQLLVTIRAGKSKVSMESDHLVNIYDRIFKKSE
jgi:hypothetical protein